jgi:hypothetical protein
VIVSLCPPVYNPTRREEVDARIFGIRASYRPRFGETLLYPGAGVYAKVAQDRMYTHLNGRHGSVRR